MFIGVLCFRYERKIKMTNWKGSGGQTNGAPEVLVILLHGFGRVR